MKCVSLYTGCGGLDLGFHEAGFSVIWANELSPFALQTYKGELQRTNRHLPEFVCGDISQAKLPAKKSAEIVIGGPPCQGFSVAGRMDPNDPRSRHVWEFFRVVEHVAPVAFVMENVKSLGLNSRWAETRASLQAKGEELGYQTRLLLLNAADYGVPQLRERMFLVGIKGQTMPTPTKIPGRQIVRTVLRELPPYGEPGNHSACKAKITVAKVPVLRKSPFAGMLFNGQGRPIDLDAPSPTLPASMGGNRTPIIDQLSLERGVKPWVEDYHKSLFSAKPNSGKVPSRLRRLTVEEAARLQGFPLGMSFQGSQCAKFTQIGNAVPPPLAYAVATTLLSALSDDRPIVELSGNQTCWVAENPDLHMASA
jgi:DNA (cytosine-5)-methyltransferase 1